MATIVEKIHLVKADPVKNNNKFWTGELMSDGTVICKWGRVGDSGQSKTFPNAGKSFLDKKVREKTSEGRNDEIAYRVVDIIDGSPAQTNKTVTSVKSQNLEVLATKQIQTGGNTIALELIKKLVKENAHNIATSTGGQITYNYDSGTFRTPLGLVGQSSIDQAREALIKVGDLVAARNYGEALMEQTRTYLMLVPQSIGHKRLEIIDFWSDLNKVQKQNDILDGLQASLTTAIKTPQKNGSVAKVAEEKVFDCKIEFIEDMKVFDRLRNFYRNTRKDHVCKHLDVRRAFSVSINTVRDAFEKRGSKMNNVMELFHGTKVVNLLSILKNGLLLPRQTSAHITGAMFGSNIYAAPASTKALNYAYGGVWDNGRHEEHCYMFVVKMAMGNYYIPNSPFSANRAPHGYDSTWAKANKSGVMNDECIVYSTDQVDLMYLLEFTPGGK